MALTSVHRPALAWPSSRGSPFKVAYLGIQALINKTHMLEHVSDHVKLKVARHVMPVQACIYRLSPTQRVSFDWLSLSRGFVMFLQDALLK
jgi:hypothetical protein